VLTRRRWKVFITVQEVANHLISASCRVNNMTEEARIEYAEKMRS
jgi:hypothetical protein